MPALWKFCEEMGRCGVVDVLRAVTPEEAKTLLTTRALPDSPVVRQLLEWIAELEKRPTKNDPA